MLQSRFDIKLHEYHYKYLMYLLQKKYKIMQDAVVSINASEYFLFQIKTIEKNTNILWYLKLIIYETQVIEFIPIKDLYVLNQDSDRPVGGS